MYEVDLIRLVADKDKYYIFNEIILEHCLTKEVETIIKAMGLYFSAYTSEQVDWEQFSTWFLTVQYPTLKADKQQVYRKLFIRLHKMTGEVDSQLLKAMIERSYAKRVARMADDIASGSTGSSLSNVLELVEAYHRESGIDQQGASHYVTDSLEDIAEYMDKGHGLNWRLPELNLSLGCIRQGDMLLFGARPETGKTTMLASEATYMAEQAGQKEEYKDRPIIWFNNEEEGRKVKLRLVQSALGQTTTEVLSNPKEAKAEYNRLTDDRIIVVDNKRITYQEVERVLARENPCLIIYDQLRKIGGFEKSSPTEVARLQQLYGKHARAMAAEYAPVITVHQARGDAQGQLFINQNQLEGSQTEVQGELDAQVMIGKSDKHGFEHTRGINIVKNKLTGDDGTDESLRHGRFEVIIKPEIGRYESP